MRRDDHAARQRGRGWGDFTLLWSASAVSQLGSTCVSTANPLLALYLTHSAIFAGWMTAATTLPNLLMYLPAGWLTDRFSRRRLMLVSQTGRLTVCASMVVALYTGCFRSGLLIVAALCEGSLLVVYYVAELTAIQRVVSARQLPPALAMNEARTHAALMMGKPLGGFLFGVGRAVPYVADVVSSIWALTTLGLMRKKDYQPVGGARRSTTSLREGLRYVVHNSFLRTVLVVCLTCNFLFQTVFLLVLVQAEQEHMSGTTIGFLLASTGIGGLIGAALGSRAHTLLARREALVRLCVAVWALLAGVVAVSPQPWLGILAWGCLSITGGLLNVAVKAYQSTKVPSDLLGRVVGIGRLSSGGVPLGALCGGYIVTALSPRGAAVMVVAGLAVVSLAIPSLFHPAKRLSVIVRWVKRHVPAPAPLPEDVPHSAPKELAPVG